jgi:hypothetical protein
MEVIDMMKSQMDKIKARTQEIEVQLNKSNKGNLTYYQTSSSPYALSDLDELKSEKSIQEKKSETLTKVFPTQFNYLINVHFSILRRSQGTRKDYWLWTRSISAKRKRLRGTSNLSLNSNLNLTVKVLGNLLQRWSATSPKNRR